MLVEKKSKINRIKCYTLPYGKDFSYGRTVNVSSKKISQASICALIKLSKQLPAINTGGDL